MKNNVRSYRFGFNGQMKVNEMAGVGNYLDFKFRGYDSRTGRFNSSDPLHRKYPWNSTYAFAENDPIRAIDLEGLERLIMTGVNKDNRTATLTIKKDIEIINSLNLSKQYQNVKERKVRKNFEFGNTTFYVKELPINGSPVEYIRKKDWRHGNGYALNVVYDVTVKLIDPAQQNKSLNGDRGKVSTVFMGNSSFSDSRIGGVSAADDKNNNISVILNPGFNNSLSTEDVITHEVGIHNIAEVKHTKDADDKPIYPTGVTLESNVPGKILPSKEDIKKIINVNLREGRLDTNDNTK